MDAGDGMPTYLINPPMLAKRYLQPEEDSFYNLLKWQAEGDEDYYIVPLVVVWSRAPEREERGLADIFFGTTNQPGSLRRLYNYLYLILVEEAIVEAADPVNLRQFLDKPEHQALNRSLLAHRLRDHLLGHFRAREARDHRPPAQVVQPVDGRGFAGRAFRVEAGGDCRDRKTQIDRGQARGRALPGRDGRQLQPAHGRLLSTWCSWVWKNLFNGIEADESDLENVRNTAKRHPVIYVPSHKSHVHYLTLSYVLYHHNFFPPHIVAGINLSFFPLGPVFRGTGAFFMRRSFKGNRVYALVFSNYLKILIKENYPIEFSPFRAACSRTGRLLLPKMGVVKYMVRAYHELGIKDLAFVPVYIGYDQVIDQPSYLHEMKGEKSDSTLRSSSRMFRQKYGKIYLSFGEPISLKDYLAQNTEKESDDPSAGFENLGYDIIKQINSLTMVDGRVARGVRPAREQQARAQRRGPEKVLDWFYKYLTERKVRLAKAFENNPLWYEEALDFYQSKKLVSFLPDQESPRQIVAVPSDARLNLEFYKNNILHFFMPAAMTALVKLQKHDPAELARDYARLKQMFRFDFIWQEEEREGAEFENARAYFETQATEEELKNFAGLVANFAESYAIALRALLGLRASRIPEKEFIARAHKIGEQSFSLREIERAEAVSNLNFSNALTWMKAEKYATLENGSLGLNPEAARVIDDQLSWLNSLLKPIRQF